MQMLLLVSVMGSDVLWRVDLRRRHGRRQSARDLQAMQRVSIRSVVVTYKLRADRCQLAFGIARGDDEGEAGGRHLFV